MTLHKFITENIKLEMLHMLKEATRCEACDLRHWDKFRCIRT